MYVHVVIGAFVRKIITSFLKLACRCKLDVDKYAICGCCRRDGPNVCWLEKLIRNLLAHFRVTYP